MKNTWLACAPITSYWGPPGSIIPPIEFANGVKLEAVPDWVRTEKALKFLGWSRRESIKKHAVFGFTVEYEAQSLGDPDPDWKGLKPRSIQEKAIEQIQLANLSIWIAKPCKLSYDAILHFDQPGDPESIRQAISFMGLVPHHEDTDNVLSADDFTKATTLHRSIVGLSRNGTLWTAVILLWKALTERFWDSRFLLLWVVLEAIFGPSDARETTFRLSQRVAFFLGNDRKKIIDIFKMTKKGYSWRSKVVHGSRLSKLSETESAKILHEVEQLIRKALIAILQNNEFIGKIDGKKREEFLDGLIFDRIP